MAVNWSVPTKRTGAGTFILPEHITVKPQLNGRHEKPDISWLKESIQREGQFQNVTIRNEGGKPVLVAGFSRWRAISELNKENGDSEPIYVRCTYVEAGERDAFIMNIAENRFRNDVSPVDDAYNMKRLVNVYSYSEEQIAAVYFPSAKTPEEIKKGVKFVKQRMALINLTPEAEKAVRDGRLEGTAADAVAKLSAEQQRSVLAGKSEGSISRKDVVGPAKKRKPAVLDAELVKRIGVMTNDIEDMIRDPSQGPRIVVSRKALQAVIDYIEEHEG